MKINKSGNIKLISLLFILGSSSAVLLIPAVIQKENYIQQTENIRGKASESLAEEVTPLTASYESIKKDYIDTPIQNVIDTTKDISQAITNPITSTEPSENFLTQTMNISNPISYILGENTSSETTPAPKTSEPMIKVTKEMVDNCKIITEEYNKVAK
jgi:hypothetical protein